MTFFVGGGVKIGKNVHINCNILTAESYLIEIGNDVTIADHVAFVTHDNSISKAIPEKSDLFGKISIGESSFIGAHTVLMYGVSLPPHTIVAAGSVVTRSFDESGLIIGGNPAKAISTREKFAEKSALYAQSIGKWSKDEKKSKLLSGDSNMLVKR